MELVQSPCKDPSSFFRIPTEGMTSVETADVKGLTASTLSCPDAMRTRESGKGIRPSTRTDQLDECNDPMEESYSNDPPYLFLFGPILEWVQLTS